MNVIKHSSAVGRLGIHLREAGPIKGRSCHKGT